MYKVLMFDIQPIKFEWNKLRSNVREPLTLKLEPLRNISVFGDDIDLEHALNLRNLYNKFILYIDKQQYPSTTAYGNTSV